VSNNEDIRETLLTVISEKGSRKEFGSNLQAGGILDEAARRLNTRNNIDFEQALLTECYELFRTGYLAWGYNISNPNPPHCHLTERGRITLERLSRDPGNPAGYLRHLYSLANLNPVSKSYLEEGLECYVSSFYKASAVMVGAASESLVIVLRDFVAERLTSTGRAPAKNLLDWRTKTIIDALKQLFDAEKENFPTELREEYEAYWQAFTQQMRATRNEAGHPTSVEPITGDTVHAAFLVFPELAKLENKLRAWVAENYR
jgi:hypothetical protein